MSRQSFSVTVLYLFLCASSLIAGQSEDATDESNDFVSARCILGQYMNATGLIYLSQRSDGGPTSISGVIANVSTGKHGWHIHANAITDGDNPCGSAGGHFNPFSSTHGAPDSTVRHVGDLGNFEADMFGVGVVNIQDSLVHLVGPASESVMFRTIVIHAGEDDVGLGGNEESLRTGNAGARAGCCVIIPNEGN